MDAEFWYCDEELLVGCCLCSQIFALFSHKRPRYTGSVRCTLSKS